MRALHLILSVLTIAALTALGGANATGSFKDDPGSSPGQAALGNIREQKLGTRTIAVSYDAAKNLSAGCVCSAIGPASPSANNGGTNRFNSD